MDDFVPYTSGVIGDNMASVTGVNLLVERHVRDRWAPRGLRKPA